MNRSYNKGRRAEYEVAAELRAEGKQVVRSAGSKGPVDLIAWDDKEVWFVQVKKGAKPAAAVLAELEKLVIPRRMGSVGVFYSPRGSRRWQRLWVK